MSSESGKRLSMDELKERNRPQGQQTQELCTTPEEWAYLLERIAVLDLRSAEIYSWLPRLQTLATQAQVEKLAAEVQTLTETLRPAGRTRETRSWRPRLPRFSLRWLLAVPVLLGMTVALWAAFSGSVTLWRAFRTLLP